MQKMTSMWIFRLESVIFLMQPMLLNATDVIGIVYRKTLAATNGVKP